MPENFALYSRTIGSLPQEEMRALVDDLVPVCADTDRRRPSPISGRI